jgi:hypothetical protein
MTIQKVYRSVKDSLLFIPFVAVICILCSILCGLSSAHAQSPVSGFNPATLTNSTNAIFIDARTFWADNALPLRAIFLDEGWEGPFRPEDTNNLDVFWKTDAGIIYRGWRLAGFYRGELFMEANRDSVEILRMLNLKQELPIGRTFNIDLKAEGFSAKGIELSSGFRIKGIGSGNSLALGFTVRYIRGEKIQEGTIKGNITPANSKEYDFDLNLDYVYDENYVYKRRDTVPGTGDGYSFDIGIKYDFNDIFSAALLFRDIMGRIYWKDVPYTIADATSATKYFDKDGYMKFRPSISGYEGYKDFTQKIPLKTDIVVTYKKDSFKVCPTINFIKGRPLYWIEVGYSTTPELSFDLGYNTNYKSISIGTAYKKALLKMYINDISFKNAMAVGLNLALMHEW